jgi:polysaccharide pyruvyl transferase CsaB
MKYRIAISGSYGGLNLGDEAILEGILRELRSSLDLDIVVFSRNPKDTEKRHQVRSIPIREMHKDEVVEELKKLDLFILGGGGILFDARAEVFLRDVTWALELNIPVMVYAISVGPLKLPNIKQLVADVLNKTNIITVRENESKRILNDLGVTQPIEVTADPALLIKSEKFSKEMLKMEGINPDIKLIGFSVREPGPAAPDLNIDHYHGMLANAADFMIERFDAQIIFIPMESGANRDPQHSHAIISKMSRVQRANVLKGNYTSPQILGLMKHMDFAVGMRLHFLIFAGLQHIPFIPLPYASKVKGLLQDLEMSLPPIEEWNTGKLCAVIDRAWDTQATIKKKLKEKIPLLKKKAKRSNEILCEFLKSLTPKND